MTWEGLWRQSRNTAEREGTVIKIFKITELCFKMKVEPNLSCSTIITHDNNVEMNGIPANIGIQFKAVLRF